MEQLFGYIIFFKINSNIKQIINNILKPCVPLTVDKNIYCTAFGIVDCAQNIGMTAFPYLFGFINDFTKNKPNTFHG